MTDLVSTDQLGASQRALTQLLLGCAAQSGAHHAAVMGALISLFHHYALAYPCCIHDSRNAVVMTLAAIDAAMTQEHPAPLHTH